MLLINGVTMNNDPYINRFSVDINISSV